MASSTTTPDDTSAARPADGVEALVTAGGPRPPAEGWAERVARSVLFVEGREVEALVPLRGSLVVSAVRCILSYVVVPLAVPVFGWLDGAATPLSLALSVTAVALAVHSLRRVWLANWSRRWGYTAFILAVIAVLVALIAYDLGQLLA